MSALAAVLRRMEPALTPAWFLLLALALALPIVIVPPADDSFVLAKETLFQSATLLLLALALVASLWGTPLRIALNPWNGLLIAFVGWNWLSVLWSDAPAMSIDEAWRWSVLALFAVLAQGLVAGHRDRFLLLARTFLLSTSLVALWVIATDIRAAWFPETMRVRAVLGDWRDALSTVALGNTSHLGDLLAIGLLGWVPALLFARARRRVITAVAALVLHAAALIVCWSLHSNLSLVIAGALGAWLLARLVPMPRWRRLMPRLAAVGAGWVFVVGFLVVDHPLNPHAAARWSQDGSGSGGIVGQAFDSPRWKAGGETRLAIWLNTLEMARRAPWLGGGAGTFRWHYPATTSPIVAASERLSIYTGSWTNAAHNELLEAWAELGVLGIFLLLALFAVPMLAGWQRLHRGGGIGNRVLLATALCALVAIALQCQMNFPLQLPVSTALFLLVAAVPAMLPWRAGESVDLVVPVERDLGIVVVGIQLQNMSVPRDISVRFELGGAARAAVAGVLVVGGVAAAGWALRPLVADVLYRPIRAARLAVPPGMMTPDQAGALADRAAAPLRWWPGHVDCRSARQDLLLLAGRHEEVIAETPLVLARLNATEVYTRRALALEALGRADEAIPDWDIAFARNPRLALVYPRQAREWLDREAARTPAP
jgi:O-antigen ligase